MMAVLAFLRANWRLVALVAVILAVLAAFSAVYIKGRNDGQSNAANAARQALVDQLNERGKIDDVTGKMDNSELCRALGRVWHNGQCE